MIEAGRWFVWLAKRLGIVASTGVCTVAVQRIEVITGAGGRRSYTDEEKLRLVGEAEGGGVAAVARRYGICKTLIYRWRRQIESGALAGEAVPSFVPVRVMESGSDAVGPSPSPTIGLSAPAETAPNPALPPLPEDRAATIEVVLANGRVLRVAEDIAPSTLRRLVEALDGG